MKYIITVGFIFIFSTAYSQQKLSKELMDFDEIKVFDNIEIKLIKAPKSKVEITGINSEKIDVIEGKNGLKLKLLSNKSWVNDSNQVVVYYKKIKSIIANKGAIVLLEDGIEEEFLDIRAKEKAKIKGTITSDKLIARALNGGEIHLKGTVREQEVVVNAGSKYLCGDLKTKNTKVKVSIGGKAEVNAEEYLKANNNIGGTIKIIGIPKIMDTPKLLGKKTIEVN